MRLKWENEGEGKAGYEVCQTQGFNGMRPMTGIALESYLSNKKFKVISQ